MHRFPSRRSIWRLRFCALCFLALGLAIAALPAAIVWGIGFNDVRGIRASIILLVCAFGSGTLFLFVSSNLRCPLCRGQILRRLHSTPINPKSRKLFGSYRLAVIGSAFFARYFRCFHCGEPCSTRSTRNRRH